MITFERVEKRFRKRTVLAELTATIPGGKVTALVGPNGSGKTTLLKLLLGLARADGGRITCGGVPLDGSPEYRRQIGYMPQLAWFPARQSGRELLQMLVELRQDGVTPDLTMAEVFGLGDQFDRPLGQLSGGTRQKVNAVLALAFRPALLVLDEPTAGLDPLAARLFKDRLAEERRAGTTVLVTSHVLPELEELADHILFLSDGRAAWQGDAVALKRHTGAASLERAVASLLQAPRALAAA
jgi:Cu-processing system ATP-binding protein